MVHVSDNTVTHSGLLRTPFSVLGPDDPLPGSEHPCVLVRNPGLRPQLGPHYHSPGCGGVLECYLLGDLPAYSRMSAKHCHVASGHLAGLNTNQCFILSFFQWTLVDIEIMTEFENKYMCDE